MLSSFQLGPTAPSTLVSSLWVSPTVPCPSHRAANSKNAIVVGTATGLASTTYGLSAVWSYMIYLSFHTLGADLSVSAVKDQVSRITCYLFWYQSLIVIVISCPSLIVIVALPHECHALQWGVLQFFGRNYSLCKCNCEGGGVHGFIVFGLLLRFAMTQFLGHLKWYVTCQCRGGGGFPIRSFACPHTLVPGSWAALQRFSTPHSAFGLLPPADPLLMAKSRCATGAIHSISAWFTITARHDCARRKRSRSQESWTSQRSVRFLYWGMWVAGWSGIALNVFTSRTT